MCWLLRVVQLPGCVWAGPGLPGPSFCVTGFRNRPRRVPGLSTTQHLCSAFLRAKCFAMPFYCLSLTDGKEENHYSGFDVKGETEIGKSSAPHKQVQINADTLRTPIILVCVRLQFSSAITEESYTLTLVKYSVALESHGGSPTSKRGGRGSPRFIKLGPLCLTDPRRDSTESSLGKSLGSLGAKMETHRGRAW